MTALAPEFATPCLQSLSRLITGPRWRHAAMRAYGQATLYWFTRGQGRFTTAGVVQGYGPHHALLLPPGTVHGFEAGAQTQGWLLFFPPGFEGLPTTPRHLRPRDIARQGALTQLIDRLSQEIAAPLAPGAARAITSLCGLIAVWAERQQAHEAEADTPGAAPTAAQRMAARFTQALEQSFRDGQDVTDIARDLGVSAAYLTRACRESCGQSAHDLLRDRRLYEARRMLRDTDQPVGDIARAAGFGSAAYFTRAFQAETGQTPSDFRRDPRAA